MGEKSYYIAASGELEQRCRAQILRSASELAQNPEKFRMATTLLFHRSLAVIEMGEPGVTEERREQCLKNVADIDDQLVAIHPNLV